ncbi:MAG: hypothetical protein AAGM84_05425 [Pseudomonadota bacterium]
MTRTAVETCDLTPAEHFARLQDTLAEHVHKRTICADYEIEITRGGRTPSTEEFKRHRDLFNEAEKVKDVAMAQLLIMIANGALETAELMLSGQASFAVIPDRAA